LANGDEHGRRMVRRSPSPPIYAVPEIVRGQLRLPLRKEAALVNGRIGFQSRSDRRCGKPELTLMIVELVEISVALMIVELVEIPGDA
jgi:hypothetical protein